MGLKRDARDWKIKEQILEDPASGLTLQFERVDSDSDAPFHLRIFGDLPYGNREIQFTVDGKEAGAGTLLTGCHKPAWLTDVDDL